MRRQASKLGGGAARTGRGFSLIELMVVITILGILIGFGVPAIGSILRDSERSLAENQLRNALSACHDAAVRSDRADVAAVFFFRPDGRTVVVACQFAGFLDDVANDGGSLSSTSRPRRRLFTPVAEIAPVVLPKGWSVRGFAPAGLITGTDPAAPKDPDGWYESLKGLAGRGLWVFPETNFVDTEATTPTFGWQRQTFMIRFNARSGQVATGDSSKVLVVDPLNTSSFRSTAPYNIARFRLDLASDPAIVARRLTKAPEIRQAGLSDNDIIKLAGDSSPDTVLAGPVTDLALYQEGDLLGALGVPRGNGATGGTMYQDPKDSGYMGPMPDPALVMAAGLTPEDVPLHIGEWITGVYKPTGATQPRPSTARLFTVDVNVGQLQEM